MHILKRGFLALCLLASAMANQGETNADLQAVSQGAQLFSSNFVKEVAKEESGNLICSPLSANIALSMAANGARDSTEQQFKEVMKFPPTKTQALSGYQNLIDNLNNVENVTLKLANKMFIANNFEVKSEYKQELQTYYHSDIETVNFGETEKAADTINSWCKEKTNDRIDKIVKPEDLINTILVLANAVYFKGNWAHKFNPSLTSDRPFHVDLNNEKSVPTMYRRGNYKYVEMPEYEAKCIELPYANEDISMVIILPDKIDGLSAIIGKLNEVTAKCSTELANAYEREVDLYLPKFKTESKLDLKNILSDKMGLSEPFSGRANFKGISDAPLKIDKVIQKAFIEVNEEGSEAAAVTVIGIVPFSFVPTVTLIFEVNRPFFYYIRYNGGTTLSLFEGDVKTPEV